MRWLFMALLVLGCGDDGGEPLPGTDPGNGGGTPDPATWQDLSVSSSSTLNAIYVGGTGAFIVGDNGTAWDVAPGLSSPMVTGTTVALTGLWGEGAGPTAVMIAVGYAGTVLDRTGRNWNPQDHSALGTANFEDIDGTRSDLTAVSGTGIYRFQNDSWSFETGTGGNLRSVYVDEVGDAWAVGDRGSIVRREGGIWFTVDSGTNEDLRGVHGRDGVVLVVGHRGTVLRWNGQSFVRNPQRISVNLQDVYVAPNGTGFIVGNNGAAYKWTLSSPEDEGSGTLSNISTPSNNHLYAISGTDDRNVWTAGARGTVLRLRPQQ